MPFPSVRLVLAKLPVAWIFFTLKHFPFILWEYYGDYDQYCGDVKWQIDEGKS
jgi:hypothetical protein